ncbi:hypothetical protein DYB32_005824 [Aphanomyces invadans]|uniref:Uncharacterized protein n=1 Tax=Aphanomyces invadans TaxID=157072 RepID=A0A418ATG3_9STRA|nr:hypothetical protein DYB32_005824 [Aphanomyces invadans]
MSSVSPATAVVPGDRRSGRNSTASYRSSGRSSILKRRLSAVKVVRTWRVSVLPGLVMFLCTLALIFLSIFLLVLLISQGMFNRQVVTVNAQLAETFFWAPYDQSCMLTSAGLHSYEAHATRSVEGLQERHLCTSYLVTGYCDTVVEELSELKESLGLTGWSQGKHSKLPIVPGWSCGHNVEHANEVIVTQVLASILSLWFIAGDVLITIEGLQGLLSGKPVLKYTVLSGLERRKVLQFCPPLPTSDGPPCRQWLLACIVVNSMPGLLYMDVSRIYYYSVNGFKIFSLSSVMVANFFTFGFIMMLSIVDTALGAVRSFHSCVGYSAPVFLAWLVSTTWCRNNSLLPTLHLPNLITALPLEPSNGIKIGNRTYCKPRKRSPTQECDSHEPATQVISIYALVPSMVVPSWVPSLGTIDQNQFTRTLGKHLAKATPVMHTRGSCVV